MASAGPAEQPDGKASAEKAEAEAEVKLEAFGAQLLPQGRHGIVINEWRIESAKLPMLKCAEMERWQADLGAFRLPEMVFGDSWLELEHIPSRTVICFNARDALKDWKDAKLPPVKVPAAAAWALRKKPPQELVLDYDYTFTTPYQGSLRAAAAGGGRAVVEAGRQTGQGNAAWGQRLRDNSPGELQPEPPAAVGVEAAAAESQDGAGGVPVTEAHLETEGSAALATGAWVTTTWPGAQKGREEHRHEHSAPSISCRAPPGLPPSFTTFPVAWEPSSGATIDWELLQRRDPILFFDEIVLYEDELADSGVSALSVRARVMPHCWFVLLRFWLRVDGALMRAYDTRIFCRFTGSLPAAGDTHRPISGSAQPACSVVRESCRREETFEELARRGLPADPAAYKQSETAVQRLRIRDQQTSILQLGCGPAAP